MAGLKKLRVELLFAPAAALGLILAAALPPYARAAKAIPESPYYYVLDETGSLSPGIQRSLQALLMEHGRLTGEQVVFAIFKSLEGEELVDFTNRVFKEWKIGQRRKNNGALLALYWQEREARIEVGYGLEPILTDAKSKGVLEDFLFPELRNGNVDRALSLAALEILTILESPLIQSGKAQEILQSGGLQGGFQPAERGTPSSKRSFSWIVLGLFFCIWVLSRLTAAEAHYTRRGWYRPNPWRRRSHWGGFGGWGGGGGFGGGGGGGFLGGGGMSGGGGASGKW